MARKEPENSTYFLCKRSDVPRLIEKANSEAKEILRDFAMYYKTAGVLSIEPYPIEYPMGWAIGGKLKWDDTVLLDETDCGLVFLHINELILKRMIELGIGG